MSSSRLLAGLERVDRLAEEYMGVLAARSEALEEARADAATQRGVHDAFCRTLQLRRTAARVAEGVSSACARLADLPAEDLGALSAAVAAEQANLARLRAAKVAVRRTDEYVSFRLRAWDVRNADRAMPPASESDSDDAESGAEVSVAAASVPGLACPVTRVRMADPVRARRCGHVFSRRGAEMVLQGVRDAPCPVAGCAHRFAPADLARADDVAARIARASAPRAFD